MARLTIYDRRERALVAAADALLSPLAIRRAFRRDTTRPQRILCLRLERIGDLLMTGQALAELRALAPAGATIDLAVGSWNREIAAAIPAVDRVETLDAGWLARGGSGLSPLGLAVRAARWRSRRYDLAINFEPDIRTNLALAAAGARRTAGFASGGGGALLDVAIDYDPSAHTIDNARRLVHDLFGGAPAEPVTWALRIPDAHRAAAARLLAPFADGLRIGMHVSGGRAIKQWPETRFREVAEHLVRDRSAAVVLTGTPADRAQIDVVRPALPPDRVLDLSENVDLLTVAAVIERLDLFVTGDTGPMHLANAVGTPIVAVFGPSDPRRYAPRGVRDTVVRIDLPCSPCNRIRLPPARCAGHTPDCLSGIEVARVLAAIGETLAHGVRRERAAASEPRERSGDLGAPASERAGESEGRSSAARANIVSEPAERSEPAKRRASDAVGESEGRSSAARANIVSEPRERSGDLGAPASERAGESEGRSSAARANIVSEPRERSGDLGAPASERAGESEGRSPSDKKR